MVWEVPSPKGFFVFLFQGSSGRSALHDAFRL